MSVPAHKQTNPAHAPGQIKTIGQYSEVMKKKLTFEEWFQQDPYIGQHILDQYWEVYHMLEHAWKAAQDNV